MEEACAEMPEVPKVSKVQPSMKLPHKDAKIKQVAEFCGVKLPNPKRSMNYQSGTFNICGMKCCYKQYDMTKVLLDNLAQMLLTID